MPAELRCCAVPTCPHRTAPARSFFSTFFMRAAKMSRANGGGSLTLLPLVPGCCATGISKRIDMSKWVPAGRASIHKHVQGGPSKGIRRA